MFSKSDDNGDQPRKIFLSDRFEAILQRIRNLYVCCLSWEVK